MNNAIKISFAIYIFFIFLIGCSNPTSIPRPPTPVYPVIDNYPAWSPNSDHIGYFHQGITRVYGDGSYTFDPDSLGLWIVRLNDGASKQLINSEIRMINWSRDGEWLVFSYAPNIYRIRISGTDIDSLSIQQLTDDYININPSWSHDGEWIYYDTNRSDPDTYVYSIWKMKADGSEKQLVIRYGRNPNLSSNGELLLYQMSVGADGYSHPEIFSLNLNTHVATQLTSREEYCQYPRMSPDCSTISFISKGNIVLMDSDGSNQRTLENGISNTWGPTSEQVCFVGKHGFLWIVDADGSNLEQLTSGPIPE